MLSGAQLPRAIEADSVGLDHWACWPCNTPRAVPPDPRGRAAGIPAESAHDHTPDGLFYGRGKRRRVGSHVLDDFLSSIAWFVATNLGLSQGTTAFGVAFVATAAALLTIGVIARRRSRLRHEAPEMATSLERPGARQPAGQADPLTAPRAASMRQRCARPKPVLGAGQITGIAPASVASVA